MNNKWSLRIFILCIFTLNSNCYSYFDLKKKTIIEKVESLPKSNKTIALIGFNDYEYIIRDHFPVKSKNEVTRALLRPRWGYRSARRVAALSRSDKDLIKSFGIGKDLATIPVRDDIPKQIDYNMLANHKFIQKEFSEKTLQSDMLYELIFRSKYLKIQKDEIDYYLVAINYTPFQKSTLFGWLSMTVSFIPAFFSFNFVPFIDHQKSYTKFLIYGKNLELLDELEISNSYFVFHSVWKDEKHPCYIYNRDLMLGFRPQPVCIWEGNVKAGKEFTKEFLEEEMSLSEHQ